MTTTETTSYAVSDAQRPLWVGQTPAVWGDVVRSIDPAQAQDAASMIAAAGLDWSVEQHPLEAVVEREYHALRVPVPRHVANVRSDTRTVLAPGGGVDYQIGRHFAVRLDYEYQFWRAIFGPRDLNPNGLTLGAVYSFGGRR